MVHHVPAGWTWSAFSLGRDQMPYVAAAAIAGGNCRVGLEDNLYLERGVLAEISRVKALKQAVISSEKALEASEAGFEVGTRTIVDVLDSQRELLRVRRDHARSRYDYLLNTLSLKQAAGILEEPDLVQINELLEPPARQP